MTLYVERKVEREIKHPFYMANQKSLHDPSTHNAVDETDLNGCTPQNAMQSRLYMSARSERRLEGEGNIRICIVALVLNLREKS